MITSIKEYKIYLNEKFKLIPGLRLPKEDIEYNDYKSINWNDIELIEEGDDGYSIMHIGVKLPGDKLSNPGIILDIQIINDELYHPHRHIAKVLQGQGLGYKMTLKFIHEFGHIYTTPGRTLNNNEVPKMAEKLSKETGIDHFKTKSNGDIWILKSNPDYNKLVSKYTNENIQESITYPLENPPMYGDSDYKSRGGVIIYNTPDYFLNLVPELILDDASMDNIDEMKTDILNGKELDPPTLYVDGDQIINHDGRHRSHAAKILGIKEIPILIIDKNNLPITNLNLKPQIK